jgi:hypothetical protein
VEANRERLQLARERKLTQAGSPSISSPAFSLELCDRFGVPALELDGSADALMHAFDSGGQKYMEYIV